MTARVARLVIAISRVPSLVFLSEFRFECCEAGVNAVRLGVSAIGRFRFAGGPELAGLLTQLVALAAGLHVQNQDVMRAGLTPGRCLSRVHP